jgi:hypothetical protein
MYPDGYIDLIRSDAYPIDALEGEDYERARVREALEWLERIVHTPAKDQSGPALAAARREAGAVFAAVCRAVGLPENP